MWPTRAHLRRVDALSIDYWTCLARAADVKIGDSEGLSLGQFEPISLPRGGQCGISLSLAVACDLVEPR